MILAVSFEEFPDAVRTAAIKSVFVAEGGKGLIVSAAAPEKSLLISCKCDLPFEEAEGKLKEGGFNVLRGRWSAVEQPFEAVGSTEAYIASVAYQSKDSMPGLWMDAFPSQPTPQIVLRALYDEFRTNDEIGEVSYEDFLKLAKPNVVILSPSEITTYLRQKEEC